MPRSSARIAAQQNQQQADAPAAPAQADAAPQGPPPPPAQRAPRSNQRSNANRAASAPARPARTRGQAAPSASQPAAPLVRTLDDPPPGHVVPDNGRGVGLPPTAAPTPAVPAANFGELAQHFLSIQLQQMLAAALANANAAATGALTAVPAATPTPRGPPATVSGQRTTVASPDSSSEDIPTNSGQLPSVPSPTVDEPSTVTVSNANRSPPATLPTRDRTAFVDLANIDQSTTYVPVDFLPLSVSAPTLLPHSRDNLHALVAGSDSDSRGLVSGLLVAAKSLTLDPITGYTPLPGCGIDSAVTSAIDARLRDSPKSALQPTTPEGHFLVLQQEIYPTLCAAATNLTALASAVNNTDPVRLNTTVFSHAADHTCLDQTLLYSTLASATRQVVAVVKSIELFFNPAAVKNSRSVANTGPLAANYLRFLATNGNAEMVKEEKAALEFASSVTPTPQVSGQRNNGGNSSNHSQRSGGHRSNYHSGNGNGSGSGGGGGGGTGNSGRHNNRNRNHHHHNNNSNQSGGLKALLPGGPQGPPSN